MRHRQKLTNWTTETAGGEKQCSQGLITMGCQHHRWGVLGEELKDLMWPDGSISEYSNDSNVFQSTCLIFRSRAQPSYL
jgi:hypothetical protein